MTAIVSMPPGEVASQAVSGSMPSRSCSSSATTAETAIRTTIDAAIHGSARAAWTTEARVKPRPIVQPRPV